jgi:hypothetical protein
MAGARPATIEVMPKHLTTWALMAWAICLLSATPAHAQLAVDATSAHRDATSAADRAAQRTARRAHQISRRVTQGLDRARLDHDRIQIQCLDRTLTEVHAVVRLVRHEREGLARHDTRELRHRRAVLVVLDQRLTDLEIQAIQCEGGITRGDQTSGITEVEVWISPDAPRIDPTRPVRPPHPTAPPVWAN